MVVAIRANVEKALRIVALGPKSKKPDPWSG